MRIGTRPSLGPSTRARQSSLCIVRGKTRRWWGATEDIAVRQTRVTGTNWHRDRRSGQSATRHASLLSNERRDAEEKEGGRGHRPCEELESWFGCPHVDIAVAEVVRRRLVSNKLGIRAAKTAAGSSERGPSSKRTAVGETIDGFGEWKVRRGFRPQSPKCPQGTGEGPDEDPGWRESATQRLVHRQKRWAGRGTRAVIATGSYEGSLTIEGIPARNARPLFTERAQTTG